MTKRATAGKDAKTSLSRKQLNDFQDLLLFKQQRALREMRRFSARRRSELNIGDNGQTSDDRVTNHLADPSAAETLILKNKRLLDSIPHALKRIEDGTYGVCEECGELIDEKRLKTKPTTHLCFSCKNAAEKRERHTKGGNGTSRRYFTIAAYA